MVVGLPLLLASAFVMCSSLGVEQFKSADGDSIPLIFGLPIGFLLAFLGVAFVLGRDVMEIDKQARTINHWSGLLVPMFSTELSLSNYTTVRLAKVKRSGKQGSYTAYTVSLTGSGKEFLVRDNRCYDAARVLAAELATFCQFRLEDAVALDE